MVPGIPELRLSVTGEAIESDTSKPITTGPGNNDRLPQAIAIPARVIGPTFMRLRWSFKPFVELSRESIS